MRVVFRSSALLALVVAVLLGAPAASAAQDVTGNAAAVQATVFGELGSTTTVLAGTGTLNGGNDARNASQAAGSVPLLLSAQVLHAATLGSAVQASSEASLSALTVTVGGMTIGADFAMARVLAPINGNAMGTASIGDLSVNGVPISVTGAPNETIAIPGGQIVINEQSTSAGSTVVNALHIIVTGVADIVVASAAAGVQ